MLILHKSHIEPVGNGLTRLVYPVTETSDAGKVTHQLWVEVREEYGKFLCTERCDAVLLGVLHYALKHGHDIEAELPVSRELYFNLTNLLIPLLCGSRIKKPVLKMAYSAELLPNAGAVGTGVSLGVDSLYTISRHGKQSATPYPVTHLLYFNVGSHGRGNAAECTHLVHQQKVTEFAREYDYELVTLNSNYADVFHQHYCDMHAFAAAFAVFSLQKLWSSYLYASAGYPEITLKFPVEKNIPAAVLMPVLNGVFATETTRFRADAEGVERFEKIRFLSRCEMAQKYLFVCVKGGSNCCRCLKCVRTILRLRLLGAIKDFSRVFPEEKCNLFHEIYLLIRKTWRRNLFVDDIVTAFFKKIFRRNAK
ncbi:MAG: hypothetical protein E7041_07085 [Lentisphaerae bacterium]|nr:hypothetical protein [Lentisphaerota bacterium]